jgi:hypothetical protein
MTMITLFEKFSINKNIPFVTIVYRIHALANIIIITVIHFPRNWHRVHVYQYVDDLILYDSKLSLLS